MRRKWKKPKKKITKKFVSNNMIKSPRVFLIGIDGEKIGNIDKFKALQMAKDENMDLVLVNPKADPPVAKITDLGRLKYEIDKKAHKQKVLQKKVDTKIIRLSVRIGKHDIDMRINQAKKFLQNNNKLKIELTLKGRERQHPGKAREVIVAFINELKTHIDITEEQPLTKQGARYIIIIVNKVN